MPWHLPAPTGNAGVWTPAIVLGWRCWKWHCEPAPAAAASPWLQHPEPSGPVGGRRSPGALVAGGILGSEPARATGCSQEQPWEQAHPTLSARGQRRPPLSLGHAEGARVGLEQGSTSRELVPPIPRHWSHTGAEVCMGGPDRTCSPGLIQTHPDPGICWVTPPVPLSLNALVARSSASRVTNVC